MPAFGSDVYEMPRLSGRATFIKGKQDMAWLREVHLPNLPVKYKSAVLVGNEDYPDAIQIYEEADPDLSSPCITLVLEEDDE